MEQDLQHLSRLRARLAGPRGARKVDALLSADDPAGAVAALPITELYQLVHEVGFADAVEVIGLAAPEQIRGCLDLDTWDRDQMQLEASKPWLLALLDAGFEKFAAVWQRLDAEYVALLLTRTARIYDLSLGEEPDDRPEPGDGDPGGTPPGGDLDRAPRPVVFTPDRFFALKLTTRDDDIERLIPRIISDLYRADPSGAIARHALMAARSEPIAELEEMAYRWRSGRMADLGYVDFYEALGVFRPIDPASVTIGEGTEDRFGRGERDSESPGPLPVPIAEQVVGTRFVARALDRIDDPAEGERLERAIMVLINKVLSAARISPGQLDAQVVGAEHALATLALGLETVSSGDIDRAARALQTISLTRLHRVGYTVTLRLARLARALAPRAATAAAPISEMLRGLLMRRPFFARELDAPAGVGARPFESIADITRVAETLTELALRVAIADGLGVDLIQLGHQPDPPALDDHIRTALLRATLDQPASAAPLGLDDLDRFDELARPDGPLTTQARKRAASALAAILNSAEVHAAHRFVPALLGKWLADLEALPRSERDPRFIDHVVVTPDGTRSS